MGLNLNKFYFDNNFKVNGKETYGVYRKRVMSIKQNGNYINVTITFNQPLTSQLGQSISNKIKEIKASNRALQKGLTTNVFLTLIFYQSADINEEFFPIFEKCLDVLDSFNLPTCETCPLCGRTLLTTDPFIRTRNSIMQVHNECADGLIASANRLMKSAESNDKKNIFKIIGICFSIMVLLVGLSMLLPLAKFLSTFLLLCSGSMFIFIFRIFAIKFKFALSKTTFYSLLVFSILTILLSFYFGGSMLADTLIDTMNFGQVLAKFFKVLSVNFDALAKPLLIDLILNILFTTLFMISIGKGVFSKDNKVIKL